MGLTTIDKRIDAAIAAQRAVHSFVPTEEPPWLRPFEQALPFRLPPSYRSLLARYRFPAITVGSVKLFGNLDGVSEEDLVVASVRDPVMARVTRAHGFIQVGRPKSGGYDPICLDLRSRSKSGEAGLVCLDHEAILIHESIHVAEKVANGFLELLSLTTRVLEVNPVAHR